MKQQLIELLKTKPHSEHNLNRYIKFIDSCRIANENLPIGHYLETHHILPKGKGWFEEYGDLRKYQFNSVRLTARQHIVAHLILWKTFGVEQSISLFYMLVNKTNHSNRQEIVLKIYSFKTKLIAQLKENFHIWKSGRTTYKNSEGEKFFLHRDDPRIQEEGLVGLLTGFKFSEESKQIMSFRKKHQKLFFLDMETSFQIDTSDFYEKLDSYLAQGWVFEKTEEDLKFIAEKSIQIREKKYQNHSLCLKGKMRYINQEGVFVGWFKKGDPKIEQQNLKVQWTENNRKQLALRLKKAAETNLGSTIYNNGIKEIKAKEHPGAGWVSGRLPRSPEHNQRQREAVQKLRSGKICWNDGITNFYILPEETPDPSWVKGMKPRKPKN